jgi:hypothetical protein
MGASWTNGYLNFDSTGSSMITVFVVANIVSWSDLMYQVLNVRGVDLTFNLDTYHIINPIASLYFVALVIIGNFFLMNLFIGVIITQYNREKELMGKDFMLTEQQKKWVKDRIMILQTQPKYKMKLPINEFRQPFFYLAQNKHVGYFFTSCILLNTVILVLQWYGQSHRVSYVLEYMNYGFAAIFTVEFLIKYVGFGNRYFKDNWNIFDTVIVIITLLSIILEQSNALDVGAQTTIIRSFRIARIFYIFKRNRTLKNTFMTFIATFPSMFNIGSMLALLVMIYSILGVYLFAEVKINGALNDNVNF